MSAPEGESQRFSGVQQCAPVRLTCPNTNDVLFVRPRKYFRIARGMALLALALLALAGCGGKAVAAVPRTDAQECQAGIAPLLRLAEQIGAIVQCVPPDPEHPDYAGWATDGVANVVMFGSQEEYYREVGAHELGHVFDDLRLSDWERQWIAETLGVDGWDMEWFADVFALAIGEWTDYGDGWRSLLPKPTEDQLDDLRYQVLVP